MKFGLTDIDYKYLCEHLILPLQKEGLTIWIFGSRARGDYQKYSDIDLLIGNVSEAQRLIISKIKELFEESNFPYKLDLVIEEDLAQTYKQDVLNHRIKLEI